jgi:enoyl-CoA hydratase/carnithine racemase
MGLVELERRGHIAILTLNRPDARNAISPEVSQAMAAALDEIEADPALRVVVLTGTGDVFSAGADLKVVAQGRGMDIARGKGGFAGVATRDFPKPLIAALEGLHGFETGLMPRLSYNADRRIGSFGAFVVKVDLGQRTFTPLPDFIRLQ